MAQRRISTVRRMTEESLGRFRADFKFVRVFAVASSIIAIVGCAIAGQSLEAATNFEHYDAVASSADVSAFATLADAVYMVFAGSFLILVASIAEFAAAQYNRKSAITGSIVLALLGAALALGGSVLGNDVINDFYGALCADSTDCTPRDDLSADLKGIVDVELAIFDTCCVARALEFDLVQGNLTEQLGVEDIKLYEKRIMTEPYGICSSGDIPTDNCDGKLPYVIEQLGLDDLAVRLCTCAPNEDNKYTKAVQAINEQGACSNFEDMIVTIDASMQIPTQSFSFLSVLVPPYKDYFDRAPEEKRLIEVPIVGNPGAPWVKADFPHGGFGCGIGMSKGFIWYTYLYAEESFSLTFKMGISTAAISVVFAIFASLYLCLASNSSLDLLSYETSGTSKAPKKTPVAQGSAISTEWVAISMAERERFEKRLRAFYEAHAPDKLGADGRVHQDVVNFGLVKGERALNSKLRARYGVDLNEHEAGSETASQTSRSTPTDGWGSQLVQRDVSEII